MPVTADRELFRTLFETAPDAILIVGPDGRIVAANAEADALFGYASGELEGMLVEQLVPEPRRGAHRVRRAAYQADPRHRPMGRGLDLKACRKDGSELPVDIMLSPLPTHRGVHVTAIVRDMTEHHAAQERLRRLADHDPLTGVLNRRRFERELSVQLRHSARYGGGALLMLDIDHFKAVNDTYGHGAGDLVLQHVASLLERRLRATDLVARLGGDEFAALLVRAALPEAELVAEDLAAALRRSPVSVDGDEIQVTMSVGVAPLDQQAATRPAALAAADRGLYAAKADGRDRIAVDPQCTSLGMRRAPDTSNTQKSSPSTGTETL